MKYRNIYTEYNGLRYASKAEANHARELDLLKKMKEIKNWDRQISFPLMVNGRKVCTYICDFQITNKDGTIELQEIKGFETAVWKIKKKLFEATYLFEHPEVSFTVIKA